MTRIEGKAAREALVHACCTTCRPILGQWYRSPDLPIEQMLCPRCWRLVERMLLDLMEHYGQ